MCEYGKDCASALRGSCARILFAECDPFCVLHAEDQQSPAEVVDAKISVFREQVRC